MICSNRKVAERWSRGQTARNHNNVFTTNGQDLFSYGLRIGFTTQSGRKVLLDYTARTGNFRSMTTSGKHISPTRSVADEVVNPSILQNTDLGERYPF